MHNIYIYYVQIAQALDVITLEKTHIRIFDAVFLDLILSLLDVTASSQWLHSSCIVTVHAYIIGTYFNSALIYITQFYTPRTGPIVVCNTVIQYDCQKMHRLILST